MDEIKGKRALKRGARVAVVILNWNGWHDTLGLFESLRQVEYAPLTVVVIDNNSTDDSAQRIESWLMQQAVKHRVLGWDPARREASLTIDATDGHHDQEFVLIRSPKNLGFCGGNNVGMSWAFSNGAEYALVLNNDTLVSASFLSPMVDAAQADPDVGLVGGVISYCSDPEKVWWAGGGFNQFLLARRNHEGEPVSVVPANGPFETDWVSGCMMLIPSWVYLELGGFDEDYFIWSEEWDYSVRVAKAGLKLVVAPEARICHKIGRSLGIMKPLNYYYGIRNGLLFQRRHLPAHLWYPFFFYYLVNRVLRYGQLCLLGRADLVRAGTDAIVDFIRGRTGKWAKQK